MYEAMAMSPHLTVSLTRILVGSVLFASVQSAHSARTESPLLTLASARDSCASAPLLAEIIRGKPKQVLMVTNGSNMLVLASLSNSGHGRDALKGRNQSLLFTFSHSSNIYVGIIHIFHHGPRLHLCASGPILLEQSLHRHSNMRLRIVSAQIDGEITGQRCSLTLIVGRDKYHVSGILRIYAV